MPYRRVDQGVVDRDGHSAGDAEDMPDPLAMQDVHEHLGGPARLALMGRRRSRGW
jgi:hypothetical protein